MKKILLITLGIFLVFVIIVTWVYLFKYGKPKDAKEVFANFGFTSEEQEFTPGTGTGTLPENEPVEEPEEAYKALRQLTTKPVGGAVFLGAMIRYAEQGTGHIYDLNLATGNETLFDGKTVPGTVDAQFSSDGSRVVLHYYDGTVIKSVVRGLGEKADAGSLLPSGTENTAFGSSSILTYTVSEGTVTRGYSLKVGQGKGTQEFEIPLRDTRVVWSNPRMLYTTPSSEQSGYLYTIEGSSLLYTTKPGLGLSGLNINDTTIVTKRIDKKLYSYVIIVDGVERELPILVMREKCTTNTPRLICGSPRTISDVRSFPDSWYKGLITYSDNLWLVDENKYTARVLSNLEDESGRPIDIYKIDGDSEGNRVWFVNKNDNTLWMFDLNPPVEETREESSSATPKSEDATTTPEVLDDAPQTPAQ